ncbi:MAG: serine/threonine protein kinase, partial [Planctomycetota bacterium]
MHLTIILDGYKDNYKHRNPASRIIMERIMTKGTEKKSAKVTTGGILLGRLALLKGLINDDQLVESLEVQKNFRKQGNPKELEEVLVHLNFLKEQQVSQLREMLQSPKYRTIGKYVIYRQLGAGAMGVVFLAKDKFTKRKVALKILPPSLAKNRRFIERFKREATATFNLEHKNLVQSFGLHKSGSFYYFAMEFIDGWTLREILSQKRVFEEKDALEIIREVTKALVYADRRNLVHRDIKPDNIMVTKDGVIKLCDLGLAKFLESDISLTQTGRAVGTPHYLSPEQARGEMDIDIRSDIYGLGVNLYLMITGKLPFNGPTAPVVLKKHILDQPTPPRKLNPDISPEVENLVLKMMAKRREDRFQKPTDLLREIDRLLGKNTLPALQQDGKGSKTITFASPRTPTSYSLPTNLRPKKSIRKAVKKEKKEYEYIPSPHNDSAKTIMIIII